MVVKNSFEVTGSYTVNSLKKMENGQWIIENLKISQFENLKIIPYSRNINFAAKARRLQIAPKSLGGFCVLEFWRRILVMINGQSIDNY